MIGFSSLRLCPPIQCAYSPQIKQANQQDENEDHDFNITSPSHFKQAYRPGDHENRLEIENYEEHGNLVITGGKSNASIPGGFNARFELLTSLSLLVSLAQKS